MRETKFRGKRLDNGEWVFGYFAMIMREKPRPGELTPRVDFCIYADDGEWYKVDPATVGQFTGLKDRDGKEIYEGGIISDGRRFHVLWDTRDACWTGEMNNDPQQRLDVAFLITHKQTRIIGNIHDNPELLKYA